MGTGLVGRMFWDGGIDYLDIDTLGSEPSNCFAKIYLGVEYYYIYYIIYTSY